jgi:hypothetical protein
MQIAEFLIQRQAIEKRDFKMDLDFVKGAIIGCSVGIAAGMLANWQDVELNLDDSTKTLAPLGQLTPDGACKEYHKAHLAVRQALEAVAKGKPLPSVLIECLKKPVKEPAAPQSLKTAVFQLTGRECRLLSRVD